MRRFREAAGGGAAADTGHALEVLLEGERLLREALASGLTIGVAAFSETALDASLGALADDVARAGGRVVSVPPAVLAAMSPVRQPSGVVSLAALSPASLEGALRVAPQFAVLLGGVQDPGNVGAIVRAAEASGATGIVAGEGTADPYGWKALRGAMGSTFRVPVASNVALVEAVQRARSTGLRIVAAVPREGTPLPDLDLRGPTAVLLGGEGNGLPASLLALADARVSIPMRAPVESLNVGVAAALIAYEAARQRAGGKREPVR